MSYQSSNVQNEKNTKHYYTKRKPFSGGGWYNNWMGLAPQATKKKTLPPFPPMVIWDILTTAGLGRWSHRTHWISAGYRSRWRWSWLFPSTGENRPCTTWSPAGGCRSPCTPGYRSSCTATSGWRDRIRLSAARHPRAGPLPRSTWPATRPIPPRW